MMLIKDMPYSNIDRMTDDAIEKSAMFTITGDTTTLAISSPAPGHLRIVIPPNYKVGDDINALIDYNLVVIPNNAPIEQIKSLSDVERLGGKIITTHRGECTISYEGREEGRLRFGTVTTALGGSEVCGLPLIGFMAALSQARAEATHV
jgi:hypothetical protein